MMTSRGRSEVTSFSKKSDRSGTSQTFMNNKNNDNTTNDRPRDDDDVEDCEQQSAPSSASSEEEGGAAWQVRWPPADGEIHTQAALSVRKVFLEISSPSRLAVKSMDVLVNQADQLASKYTNM